MFIYYKKKCDIHKFNSLIFTIIDLLTFPCINFKILSI